MGYAGRNLPPYARKRAYRSVALRPLGSLRKAITANAKCLRAGRNPRNNFAFIALIWGRWIIPPAPEDF
jgi:hypothetical protein